MLLNNINNTKNIINEVLQINELEFQKKKYSSISKLISDEISSVKNYSTSIDTLNKIDKEIFIIKDSSKTLYHIKRYEKNLQDNIFEDGELYFILQDIKNKEKDVREKWQQYVSEKTNAAINTLQSLKNLFEDKTVVTSLIVNMNRLQTAWPVTNDVTEKLDEYLDESNNFIKTLKLTKDVEVFLMMVMKETATISDLTPEILQWIKENNFNEVISLKFKY